ncbi:cytidine/deoxycytidylate deaminase family protein [Vibrio cyclitrophicus]|uniref:deoxycytidylate deaminase n=1 Tax=Vibrio cyclitrophicus TaxID=47951 RepID=UPI0018E42197|nr:deaminase [Vibrio cyclitrophicus]MCC4773864.1 deaminase [Vibrio cyclitrophicus]MCC4841834.1 deaminase [Vibrio cyclitrophicus]
MEHMMNIGVLTEIFEKNYILDESSKAKNLEPSETRRLISELILSGGSASNFTSEENVYYEEVILKLYEEEIQSKIKWRNRMIELAKHVSVWSRDKSKVGAVLVSKKGGDITLGYNGFPFGVKDCPDRYDEKKQKLNIIVHAEVNAIIAAGARAADGHLYVAGKPICARCAGPIIQSGIKRVFAEKPLQKGEYEPPTDKNATDWHEIGNLAITMLKEAGVECIFFTKTSDGYEYSDFS